LKLMRSAVWN